MLLNCSKKIGIKIYCGIGKAGIRSWDLRATRATMDIDKFGGNPAHMKPRLPERA
jgi:hypothetical protein